TGCVTCCRGKQISHLHKRQYGLDVTLTDKAGNIIKKMDIIPDLNITPPYFRKWVNEVFPEREG
ncbi:hypothetical protein, partial [Erwinia persicina]|uniref:hypothetical protein n=1 Tax=Erwinia persicina TaxID=55211 RepID=UPI001A7E4B43